MNGRILFHSGEAEKESSLDTFEIGERLRLNKNQLVTLSACETGMVDIRRGEAEEYIGLASGFIMAGAPAVVSSLWRVNDLATSLLMEKFYSILLERRGSEKGTPKVVIAEALCKAQSWVRELTKEEPFVP
jgi:CHAT domain-containing protein